MASITITSNISDMDEGSAAAYAVCFQDSEFTTLDAVSIRINLIQTNAIWIPKTEIPGHPDDYTSLVGTVFVNDTGATVTVTEIKDPVQNVAGTASVKYGVTDSTNITQNNTYDFVDSTGRAAVIRYVVDHKDDADGPVVPMAAVTAGLPQFSAILKKELANVDSTGPAIPIDFGVTNHHAYVVTQSGKFENAFHVKHVR